MQLKTHQSGFTMIEVLVSIMILSVGVLGMTSMQGIALASNRDALLRIEASQLTVDLIDRIEANGNTTYGPIALGEEPNSVTDCSVNNCTPAAMEAYDVTQWLCAVNSVDASGAPYTACDELGIVGALPLGEASIKTIDDEYSIKVQWTEAKSNKINSVQLYMQIPI